jgi:hypothetical protein
LMLWQSASRGYTTSIDRLRRRGVMCKEINQCLVNFEAFN